MASDPSMKATTPMSDRSPDTSSAEPNMEKTVLPAAEQLLKAVDVAQRLNISLPMAYRLMQRGEIPVVRISSVVRVKPSDLNAYIDRARRSIGED